MSNFIIKTNILRPVLRGNSNVLNLTSEKSHYYYYDSDLSRDRHIELYTNRIIYIYVKCQQPEYCNDQLL